MAAAWAVNSEANLLLVEMMASERSTSCGRKIAGARNDVRRKVIAIFIVNVQ